MAVQLIDCTHNPDLKVAVAALTSITGHPPSEIHSHLRKNGMWEEDRKKLADVLKSGHLDILEHATFAFSLNDISRLTSFTLVRHRIPTFTQVSQRYTPLDESGIFTPKSIEKSKQAKKIFDEFIDETFDFYYGAMDKGHEREDARYGLCIATKTHLLMTVNLRELLYIISCNSQSVPEEVSDISRDMLSSVKEKAPLCSRILEGIKDKSVFGEYAERQSLKYANRFSPKDFFSGNEICESQKCERARKDDVRILDCTARPGGTIARMAVNIHSGGAVRNLSGEEEKRILSNLKERSEFPKEFEYAHVTFGYEESLVSAHQDIRHRMRTMGIQSVFSIMERSEPVTPPSFEKTEFEGRLEGLMILSKKTYKSLLNEGIPAADAAYVALNASKAGIVSDFDFRNLLKAMSLRCCLRAQWEIRGIYDEMLKKMTDIAPEIFRDAGPGCRKKTGCPEGNLICEKPRGKYFPHEIYKKKYPELRLAQKLKEIKD